MHVNVLNAHLTHNIFGFLSLLLNFILFFSFFFFDWVMTLEFWFSNGKNYLNRSSRRVRNTMKFRNVRTWKVKDNSRRCRWIVASIDDLFFQFSSQLIHISWFVMLKLPKPFIQVRCFRFFLFRIDSDWVITVIFELSKIFAKWIEQITPVVLLVSIWKEKNGNIIQHIARLS